MMEEGGTEARNTKKKMLHGRRNRMTIVSSWWLLIIASVLSGARCQQQSFRVRPSDVESKVGDTAIIRCEVDNQVGPAQWTRRAFALGFDRSLPSIPRLSMVGDADKGVHNLRIENVTLSDIGEYQCQIGPGKGNKPIRSDARLNVLVPPSGLELSNHAAGATITLKEKESTELECIVREARPAATVIWFKNDQVLRTETREDTTELVESVEGSVSISKNTTRSKIKFFPSSEDDGARYSCEARHPALSRPLRVSVVLSVQYPPGAPQIEGYVEGEAIRENQSVTLVCVSRGGNPLAELIWYKNDVRFDSTYETGGKESKNPVTFIANTKDNLSRFRCEANNVMSTSPKIADVVLTVMFPPREVKITGSVEAKVGDVVSLVCATSNSNPRAEIAWFRGGLPLESSHNTSVVSPDGGWTTTSNVSLKIDPTDSVIVITCQGINRGLSESKVTSHTINVIQPPGPPLIYKSSMNINEGHLHKVTCTSTGGHPPAQLQWFRENKKVDSILGTVGNTAQAELALVANASDNGVTYRCEAKNKALSTPLSESVTFHVLFPPSKVVISVKPRKLKEGEKGYLTCESASSNPPAKVSWLRDGMSIPSHSNSSRDGMYGGKKTITTLELDLTSELDNVVYTCQAFNSAVKKYVHDATTLAVNYKPKLLMEGPEKVTVVEGDAAVVVVKAKGNPDVIKYKWSRNSTPVKTRAKKVFVDGPVLNFTEVTRKDKGKYEVEASNSEGATVFTIDLDVQYSPTVTSLPQVMVGVGEVAHVDCRVDANPLDESMVKWVRNSDDNESSSAVVVVDSPRARVSFTDNKSYLDIESVERSDAGSYTCVVNNGIGGSEANSSVYIVVKQSPEMDESGEIAKAASNKGGVGRLVCRARGAPNVTFSWARDGSTIITTSNSTTTTSNELTPPSNKYTAQYRRVSEMLWESVLLVHSVSSSDYGPYRCTSTNELGSSSRSITLDVTSVPDPPVGLRVVNFTHDSVTLTWLPGFNGGYDQSYRVKLWKTSNSESGHNNNRYEDVAKSATVYTVGNLELGTEYAFAVVGVNLMGEGNYTKDSVRQRTAAVGNSFVTTSDGVDVSMNPFSRLVILVFVVVGGAMLLINVFLIACFIKRRTKKRLSQASEGSGSSKSATIEMYAPSSYNETVNGETLSSISEKSNYSHTDHHQQQHDEHHHHHEEYLDEVKPGGVGVSGGYLVDGPHHHHHPQQQQGYYGVSRASTLPRKIHHNDGTLQQHNHNQHEDDNGYVAENGSMQQQQRMNPYLHPNQQSGEKMYGRTLGHHPHHPHQTSTLLRTRPPLVPPIPELYNIPPEARYIPAPPTMIPFSSSSDLLNHHTHTTTSPTHYSPQQQPMMMNGGVRSGGPISPSSSVLSTFAAPPLLLQSPPPPTIHEHEGHLV